MLDLVVRGDTVVTSQGVGAWEIGVQGERIVSVGPPGSLPKEAVRSIEATGRIVVPGGVEPHTHLAHYISMHPEESFYTLGPEEDTRGLAFGGTTTHIDFCFIRPGVGLQRALEERVARWTGRSHVDYSFHVTLLGALDLGVFEEIPEAIQQGFPSFKVFTADLLPPHPKRESRRLDFGRMQFTMEKLAKHGGILAVHAEDHDVVQFMYERFRREGRWEGWNMHLIHNKLSELLSFRRTIEVARVTGAAVYFVHTSAKEGVEAVAEARADNLPVYAETLHHYACFSSDQYKMPRGYCYHTYPSLKGPEDQQALWSGLIGDDVSTTATDEFPTSLELKLRGQTVENVTGGNLGAEARMGIVYTEGVAKRGMSLARFADVTSTNAAKIFGLFPKKGVIAVGSDADLAIIDPSIRKRLTRDDFHVSDYSPWEGWDVSGWPVTTILRGKVIVEGGRLSGTIGDGELVRRRKIEGAVLGGPAC
jgi:dihydropyrimidinase